LNEPIVEELDVSGAKRIEDRELGLLVERVERGESGRIIVWKLSRFSRNLQDCVNVTTRIKAAGGGLIAEDFDTANSGMATRCSGCWPAW
jgi:DNA invertase Pin-like site-specific DNA recombinase